MSYVPLAENVLLKLVESKEIIVTEKSVYEPILGSVVSLGKDVDNKELRVSDEVFFIKNDSKEINIDGVVFYVTDIKNILLKKR